MAMTGFLPDRREDLLGRDKIDIGALTVASIQSSSTVANLPSEEKIWTAC